MMLFHPTDTLRMSKKLHIGSLNIHGNFVEKCKYVEFISLVCKHDMFFVQESWLNNEAIPRIVGYDAFRSDRNNKKVTKGSGGVLIYFKNTLHKFLTKIPSASSDSLWVKLDKHGFDLASDIYICCSYIVPRPSLYFQPHNEVDKMTILCNEISHYKSRGEVILMGDLNSRVAQSQENHETFNDEYDQYANVLDTSHTIEVAQRHNMDKSPNQNGNDLMHIINDSHMFILNGRCPGDLSGKFTYHGPNGSSSIDLCIVSDTMYNRILYFQVLEPQWFTDHCPISVALKTNRCIEQQKNDTHINPCNKLKWSPEHEQVFMSNMSSVETRERLRTFLSVTLTDVDEATSYLSNVLTDSIPESAIQGYTPKLKYQGDNYRENYNPNIQIAKREFKQRRRQFTDNLKDKNTRLLPRRNINLF